MHTSSSIGGDETNFKAPSWDELNIRWITNSIVEIVWIEQSKMAKIPLTRFQIFNHYPFSSTPLLFFSPSSSSFVPPSLSFSLLFSPTYFWIQTIFVIFFKRIISLHERCNTVCDFKVKNCFTQKLNLRFFRTIALKWSLLTNWTHHLTSEIPHLRVAYSNPLIIDSLEKYGQSQMKILNLRTNICIFDGSNPKDKQPIIAKWHFPYIFLSTHHSHHRSGQWMNQIWGIKGKLNLN